MKNSADHYLFFQARCFNILLTFAFLLGIVSTSKAQVVGIFTSDSIIHLSAKARQSTSATITVRPNVPMRLIWVFNGENVPAFTLNDETQGMFLADGVNAVPLTINFSPPEQQQYDVTLVLSDSSYEHHTFIHCIGEGTDPGPLLMDFSDGTAEAPINSSSLGGVRLTNPNAKGTFIIHSISLNNGLGAFKLTNRDTLPDTLGPKREHQALFTFTPTQEGLTYDSMAVRYSDIEGVVQTIIVPIIGLGKEHRPFNGIMLESDSVIHGIIAYNNIGYYPCALYQWSDDTVRIDSVYLIGDTNFSFHAERTLLPNLLLNNESYRSSVIFNSGQDYSKQMYTATLHMQMTGGGHTLTRDVPCMIGVFDSTKASVTNLAAGMSNSFDFEGNGADDIRKTIVFRNPTAKEIKVKTVGLKDGSNFSISLLYPNVEAPLSIRPYSALYIVVTLTNAGIGSYSDQLIIVTDDNLASTTYDLSAKRLTTDGVAVLNPTSAELLAQPNPSSGPINFTIENAAKATITVYDLLGNAVYSQESVNGHWTWSGYTSIGTRAANGMYLIRAQGTKQDGTNFQTSTQVLLAP